MIAALAWLVVASAQAKEIGRLTSQDGLSLVFRASPVANLTYQLDCLAGVTRCTLAPYEELWKMGDWTAEDDAAVRRWAALMRRIPADVGFGRTRTEGSMPTPPRGLDLQLRARIAGLRADGWDDYAASLGLLLPAEEAREAVEITDRFLPRFERWWRRSGRVQSEAAAAGLFWLSEKDGLPDYFTSIARFYGDTPLAGQTVEFDFVALPSSSAHHSSGEELENYAEIEAVPGEPAEERIDAAAKALLPALDRWLADGTRLGDPAFIAGYLDAASRGLGSALYTPAAWYRAAEFVYGPGHDDGPRAFIDALNVSSGWTYALADDSARTMMSALLGPDETARDAQIAAFAKQPALFAGVMP